MRRRGGERGKSEREVREKGGKGWRKGNRQGGRDRDVGVSHGKVPPPPVTQQLPSSLTTNGTQAQRRRGKGLLTLGPRVFAVVFLFWFFHSLALEGSQIRKQGTQRAPAILKDIKAQLTFRD